jgi:PAS domain S-box-containing protein
MQVPGDSKGDSGSASSPEADLTRLFNLSLDLLCVAGFDGYLRRVNPSWIRVLGWTEAELLARPVADFMHPDDREIALQARAGLAEGFPVIGLENRYRCKDGSYRWLSWQSVAEPGAATVFAVARDVTERRQIDHEQLVMSKLESTGILAGGVAHDFNNLLTGLALNLDMVRLGGAISPMQAQNLQRAREIVDVAKSLTDQLIAFSGNAGSTRTVADLKEILKDASNAALLGADLIFECRLAADLWRVEVDAPQFAQVIRGLILNAREALPARGTVTVRADNVVLPTASGPEASGGEWVRICVIDDGVGIPPEVMSKVFDPYFSTKQRGSRKGMGLGLTICRVVIRRHGGSLTIESRPNEGTTVTCLLPAVSSPTDAIVH